MTRRNSTTYRDYDDREHHNDAWDAATDRLKAVLVTKVIAIGLPWAAAYLLLPSVGGLARLAWAGDPWIAVLLGAAAALIGLVTWMVSHDRRPLGRIHATVSAAGPVVWLAAVTLWGLNRITINALLIVGGTVALLWNIRKLIRSAYGEADPWARMIAPSAGLTGTRLTLTQRSEEHARGVLEPPRGQLTGRELAASAERVASAMGLPPNGVRIVPDAEDAGRAHITLTRRDLLKAERVWELPEWIGLSVGDAPVRLGRYEDGEPAVFDVLGGEDRDISHLLIVGASGSGKSIGALSLIGDLMTRRDVVVIAADTVKGRQTLDVFADHVAWFATTRRDARALLAAVKRAIPVRAGWLGEHGHRKWAPGCGIPLLVVWLEEAPDYIPDSQTFNDLARQARSAGIMLVVSVHRTTHDNIPTTARKMLGSVLCFGVNDDRDADFALGELTDQGARPELWKDKRKGYAYLVAGGIDPARYVIPLRTDHIQVEQMRQVAAWGGRAPLDQITADAFGPAYAERHAPALVSASAAPASAPMPASALAAADDADDTDKPGERAAPLDDHLSADVDVDLDDVDEDLDDDAEAAARRARADAIPDTLRRPNRPIPLPRRTRMPTEQARAALRAQIAKISDTGDGTFEVRQLHRVVAEAGRSEGWLYQELNALIRAGRLERADQGVYRMLTPADAGAGRPGPGTSP